MAMNTAVIDPFSKRRQVFLAKGQDEAAADGLADKLVRRDRDGDGRCTCLECIQLKGHSVLRCEKKKVAGIATTSHVAFIHKDFGMLLKRCGEFSS